MRTCPHCGSELHDDSTFCFACMSIVNEREEMLIKVNTSRKRTIPIVCVAVAIIAASSVFAIVSKKNNAVETKTPEPAQAVTTSATVTTTPQTTTAATTTVPTTTTTTAPAPTADEIDKISGGIRQASTGTAGTTTTTTALPEETQPEEQNDYQPNEAQQEVNTAPAEPEPSYYSDNGANKLSKILVDKINKKRESKGYTPLRVSGQLDSLLALGIDTMTYEESEGEIDHWEQVTIEKLKSNASDFDLPSDSDFINVAIFKLNFKNYDEAFEYTKNADFSNLLFTDDEGSLTVYSQRLDHIYLGCIIYDDLSSQTKPNGEVSNSNEYVCEVWVMK